MGIETIALVGLAVSAAAAGTQAYQSERAADKSDDARKKQEGAMRLNQARLDEAQKQNDATAAARVARMRQRAILSAGGQSSTIATSPLGLSATQGSGGGPQPLKSLGA